MRLFRRGWRRLLGTLAKRHSERELADEVASHIEMQVEDNLRAGMAPAEAVRAARLKFGGVESVKESYRDQRGFPLVESIVMDVRYALRGLRKNPGFADHGRGGDGAGNWGDYGDLFHRQRRAAEATVPRSGPAGCAGDDECIRYRGDRRKSDRFSGDLRALAGAVERAAGCVRFSSWGGELLGRRSGGTVEFHAGLGGHFPLLGYPDPAGARFYAGRGSSQWSSSRGHQPRSLEAAFRQRSSDSWQEDLVERRTIHGDRDRGGQVGLGASSFLTEVYVPLQIDPSTADQGSHFMAMARLKPGVTLEQARERLQASAAEYRAKFPGVLGPKDGFTLKPIRETLVGRSSAAAGADGRGEPGAADRVRECGESAAGAGDAAETRDRDPSGYRWRARKDDPSTADGERAAFIRRGSRWGWRSAMWGFGRCWRRTRPSCRLGITETPWLLTGGCWDLRLRFLC